MIIRNRTTKNRHIIPDTPIFLHSSKKNVSEEELLTNGFNSVKNKSWMWGNEVTVETSGGLKSWFGQVDIHSYSYAWAGDTKVIDADLYSALDDWDKRKLWFNDGIANKTYKLCPDKKFFSADNPYSTHEDDIDREWLSDDIFMRYESMYLIAAEAALRLNNLSESAGYLKEITSRRINHDDPDAANDYAKFEAKLSNEADLTNAVILNWRIEMWGEGYSMQMLRRLAKKWALGKNHINRSDKEVDVTGSEMELYQVQMPTSEARYNPNIIQNTELVKE